MSKSDRLEWSKQISQLNDHIKQFQHNPSQELLDAAVKQMQAYAEAARSGGIEIPTQFVAN